MPVLASAGYLPCVDVSERELPYGCRAYVSNRRHHLARKLALDDEVPRLDVAAAHQLVGCRVAVLGRVRQRNPSRADVEAENRRDPHIGAQRLVRDTVGHVSGVRGDGLVAVDARERPDNRQRKPTTQRLCAPGMRVVSNAVPASDHCGRGQLVGETDPGGEELFAPAHAVISGDTTPPTDQGFVGSGVIRFDPQAVGAPPVWVKLPSQSQAERQLGSGAPAVADVESVLAFQAVHLDELAALP